jgi:hypothetical protein
MIAARRHTMLVWDDGRGLVAARTRPRDWLTAHVVGSSLDAQLASGRSPEAAPALALRAQMLVRPSHRRALACSIREVISRATRPARVPTAVVPVSRARVLDAAVDLAELGRRLDGGGPVAAEGVARVAALLRDGRGPLYSRCSTAPLRQVVQSIIQDLDRAVTA